MPIGSKCELDKNLEKRTRRHFMGQVKPSDLVRCQTESCCLQKTRDGDELRGEVSSNGLEVVPFGQEHTSALQALVTAMLCNDRYC